MTRRLVLIGLLVVPSCSAPTDDGRAGDERALAGQLDAIERMFSSGRPKSAVLEEYAQLFTEDAVLLPPGADPIVGRDEILGFYVAGFEDLEPVALEYGVPDLLVEGDLAVRRYEGVGVALLGQDTLRFPSRYIDVLRRRERGWRIHWHTWSPIE